ncbi:MAG: type III-A CRISPR-associated RAMP protein Csm5, partial [Bacteroidetes bacterium SW_10_40_5]
MAKFTLTTLTPVHIGSGRVLSFNTEYLNFPNEGVCGVIDEQKVLDIIGTENIDKWVATINNQEDLLEYLKQRKPDLKPEDVASRVLKGKFPRNTRVSLREQLFAGKGKPLIPGSSLKGPIRTAYLNTQLEQKFGKDSIPDNYLLTEDRKTGEQKVATDKDLQKVIFGNNPNNDIFRFVRVYDAMPDCDT